MPKIYSEEKRQEIKEKLIEAGLELIKQKGMRKTSVEEITKKVGIAQGTFYNFFKSKEILIYEISSTYKERINHKMEEIVKQKGHLDRKDLRELYHDMIFKDEDNVYRFLTREDVQILLTRLPSDYFSKIGDIKSEIENNLCYVNEKKEEYDINSIINWIQIMNLTIQNKDILIESSVEKNVDKIIENMLDEIF